MKTKAYERQSLLDIALIVAGDADAAFDIALQNGLSITDKIGGSEILTYSAAPINRAVLQYYRNNNIEPATALDYDANAMMNIFDYTFDNTFE